MNKHQTRSEAFKLRYNGKSLSEIHLLLKVPKSTLSGWFKDDPECIRIKNLLSTQANRNSAVRMRLIMKRRKSEWELAYRKEREYAISTIKDNFSDPLFVTGLALYWGEGDNNGKGSQIRISNSDPMMLRIFKQFLEKYFPDICAKTRLSLILYPDLNDNACRRIWSKDVEMPLRRFSKSVYILGRSPRRLTTGIGILSVSSKRHRIRLLQWIEEAKKKKY